MNIKQPKLVLALAILLGSASLAVAVQAVSEGGPAVGARDSLPTAAGTVVALSPVASSEVAPAQLGDTFLPYIVGGQITPTIGISQTATLSPDGTATNTPTVSVSPSETLVPGQSTATPSPNVTATPSATRVVTTPLQVQTGLWQDLSNSDVKVQFYVNDDRFTLSSVAISITSCGRTFNLPLGLIENNGFTITGGSDEAGVKARIEGQFTSATSATGTWRIEGSTGCNSSLLTGTWTAQPT